MIKINYEFEKKKLYSLLGESLSEELKGQKCYVAGGMITSLFCNREVNDIDIYFKSEEAFVNFVESIWDSGGGWIVASTDKATLIKVNKYNNFQMIHFKYFPKAEDIFETFDFTVCMGAYDFEHEQFYLHPDFMQHNSQRILKFNSNTAFPIVSLLRVQKYKDKGYSISKPEFLRIALTCMSLKIDTYGQLKEQLGGMYGVNYDKLFKDKEGEVDLEEAIAAIENLCLDDDYFKQPESFGKEMGNLEDFLDDLIKSETPYFECNGQIYRIINNKLRKSNTKPKYGVVISPEEYFKNKKYYKFVKKNEDKYISFWDSQFEYKIGEVAVAKGTGYGGEPSLYFNELSDIKSSSYVNEDKTVLLEVSFNPEDFVNENDKTIRLKKCFVIREVPTSEYQKYLGQDNEDDLDIPF